MKSIDINVDVGEGFGYDRQLMSIATSANICCGAHSGDVELSKATASMAKDLHVRIGAHPGLPDRSTMGRGPMPELHTTNRAALFMELRDQCLRLIEWGAVYVKFHGTLYNAAANNQDVCGLVTDVMAVAQLPLMGLPGTLHESAAKTAGVPFIREGFADRSYDERGQLLPRGSAGAVLVNEEQIVAGAGNLVSRVDSICVHGDTPGCVALAQALRKSLESQGYEVKA